MKHQTFITLTNEELYEGLKACSDNAQRHYKCALELEKIEQYGVANSLLILSGEEAIKTLVVFLRIIGDDHHITDASPYFKQHTPKHHLAKQVYSNINHGLSSIPILKEKITKDITRFIKDVDGKKTIDDDKFMLEFAALFADTMENARAGADREQEKREQKWWNQADYYKNRGFYVNYVDGSWQTPSDLSKELFLESKEIIRKLFEIAVHLGTFEIGDHKHALRLRSFLPLLNKL